MELVDIIPIIISVVSIACAIFFKIEEHKLKKREEQRQLEDRRRAEFDTRPCFEVEEFAKEYGNDNKQEILKDCELNVLLVSIKEYKKGKYTFDFYYEYGIADNNNWASATYKFKNIGKTEISSLDISAYSLRNTALFDVECVPQGEEHYLNYSISLDKVIKPDDTFTLKVNYMKGKVIGSIIKNATLKIWMRDVYGNCWGQELFPHEGKVSNSRKEDWETYKIYTQIDTALECFENPGLW